MAYSFLDDIHSQFILSLGHHADEMVIVLKGHLFIEYIINQIIELKCQSPSTILKDHRSYTFSVKLQIIYSMKLIPHHTYLNIRKVNNIRNKLAHNLEFDEKLMDYKFYKDDGVMTIDVRRVKKRTKYPLRQYLKLLIGGTLVDLRNLCIQELNFFPTYEIKS